MNDANKTKQQLINELEQACQRIAELQASETQPKRAEEELKKSKELFEAVFSSQLDAIFVLDEASPPTIIDCNPAAGKIFGYAREEMVGQTTSFLHVNQETLKTFQSGLYPAIAETGLFYLADFYMKRKDGTVFPTEHSVIPLVNDKGERVGWMSVLRDITERKQAEEVLRQSEEKYRQLFELGSDALFLIETETGRILDLNAAAIQTYGYSREEALQMNNTDFSAEPDKTRQATAGAQEDIPLRYHKKKDGSIFPSDISVAYFTQSEKEVCVAAIRDITERKQAQEALRESQQFSASLLESSPNPVLVINPDTSLRYVNPALEKLTGFSSAEIIGKKAPYPWWTEETLKKTSKDLRESMRRGAADLEELFQKKNGERFWVQITSGPVRRGGEFQYYLANWVDITERKKAEEALRQSEERYRTILEEMDEAYYEQDLAGNFTFVNNALCRRLGYSREELMGLNYRAYIPEKDVRSAYEAWNKVFRTSKPLKWQVQENVTKDGTRVFVESCVSLLRNEAGEINGFRGVSRDITDRKQAEGALRQSEERYRTILEEMEEGYYELDLNGNLTFCNDSYRQALGYSPEEITGMDYAALLAEADRDRMFEMFTDIYRKGKLIGSFTCQALRKDGSTVTVESAASPLRDEEGQIIGFRGVGRDITERKKVEEALRESEKRLRLIAQNVKEMIWTWDMNLRYTYVSPSVARVVGYSVDEAMALTPEDIATPASFDASIEVFAEELALENMEEKDLGRSRTLELELMRKDGSTVWVEMTATFLRDEEGQAVGILGVARDISERKQAEEEKKELEQKAQLESRLATVGLLASGVGHEINNPLTGVIGYSELLLEKDLSEDIKKDLKAINEGAQRVANIVKKLVAFARYQKPQRTYASINDTLATTLDLLAHQLETSNIKTNLHLDPNLPWTMADIGQLQQVFLNIVINAETEMRLAHGKGRLSIKTEKTDNTIRISFQDNGPGIAEENLEKIFDPFFTTREVGQGTGLGLSICHEIITEHNGRLYAQSEPGKGATFIVELPVVTEEQQAQAPEPVAEEAVKVARARILVVDDEPVILDFVSRVLSDEGHEVETVANAKDALKKIKSERYGLILLDMKLPGMRGDELYKRIQRIAGSLTRRVVFITGDVLGPDTMDFIARTEAPCVTKPFDAEQLKKAVNTILAEGA